MVLQFLLSSPNWRRLWPKVPVSAHNIEGNARRLGDALPPLVVKAERIAATVMLGAHGLRRAGPGETFWAYRDYAFGDPTQRIDWRKSAKADETLIRENEWEVANTLWLWVDASPRMNFKSALASETKTHHAQVLGLAMAALALRAHERVGLLGSGNRASYGRHVLPKLAFDLAQGHGNELPKPNRLQRRSTLLLVSDFLMEPEELQHALSSLAESGMRGHLLQVNDAAEESLPYGGRVDFLGLDVKSRYRASKVQTLRGDYAEAFIQHRQKVKDMARRMGFTFNLHRTDKPLTQAVLALHQVMGPA